MSRSLPLLLGLVLTAAPAAAANYSATPVLLVDADERQRRVTQWFALNGSPGRIDKGLLEPGAHDSAFDIHAG